MSTGPELPFFFYGTLMDPDVFALVTGRGIRSSSRRRAVLTGYRRVCREGASYPILVPAEGARVGGYVVAGLGKTETARLCAFEGDDYDLARLGVDEPDGGDGGRITARTFMPKPGVPASPVEWTLEEWRRRHKARYLARLRTFGLTAAD